MPFFSKEPNVNQIDPQDVKKMLDAKEKFLLVDVRTDGEYARNRITSSIHIPLDQLERNMSEKLPDKNSTIVVYCLSGSRSIYGADILLRSGYKHVYNMKNGLLAWNFHKFPLE